MSHIKLPNGGTVRTFPLPPPGFDPLKADNRSLALHGFPRRPDDPNLAARWEAILIIAIGLGVGLAIAATALLPLSNALNGGLPCVPARPLAAILGITTLLALLALTLPTRRVLRMRPTEAVGIR